MQITITFKFFYHKNWNFITYLLPYKAKFSESRCVTFWEPDWINHLKSKTQPKRSHHFGMAGKAISVHPAQFIPHSWEVGGQSSYDVPYKVVNRRLVALYGIITRQVSTDFSWAKYRVVVLTWQPLFQSGDPGMACSSNSVICINYIMYILHIYMSFIVFHYIFFFIFVNNILFIISSFNHIINKVL